MSGEISLTKMPQKSHTPISDHDILMDPGKNYRYYVVSVHAGKQKDKEVQNLELILLTKAKAEKLQRYEKELDKYELSGADHIGDLDAHNEIKRLRSTVSRLKARVQTYEHTVPIKWYKRQIKPEQLLEKLPE